MDRGRRLELQPLAVERKLVRGDQPGTEAGGEVLALRGAEANGHLAALNVAGAPVVEQREPGNLLIETDDGRDLELEIEHLARRWPPHGLAGTEYRSWIREIKDRSFVPRVWDLRWAASLKSRPDVALVGIEVAHAGRRGDRG